MIRRRTAVAVGLIALWAVWFAPQLFSTGVPFRRDALYLYLPLHTFLRDQILHGRLPEWFPYENLGVPFIGQIVTATFHPLTWLLLPFSPAMALKLSTLLAYLAALAGGYKLSRAIGVSRTAATCGGVALAFSGYTVSMSDNLPYAVGIGTLPWVTWAALRVGQAPHWRHVAALGGLWALVLLGGDVQAFVIAPVLILAALIATRASWQAVAMTAAGGVLALICSAIEWLPATTIFSQSSRLTSGFLVDPLSKWALKPARMAEMILPHLFPHDRAEANQLVLGDRFTWSAGIFMGAIVFALIVVALTRPQRHVVAFASAAAIALWLALGTSGGLLPLMPLGAFRFPEKYLAIVLVALVPLVASGAQALLDRRRWSGTVGVLLVLAFVSVAAFLVLRTYRDTWVQDNRTILRLFIDGAEGALLSAAFIASAWILSRRFGAVLPILIAFELWFGNHSLMPTVPASLLSPERNPFAAVLQRPANEPPRRIVSEAHSLQDTGNNEAWVHAQTEMLRPDVGGLYGIGTLGVSALPGQSQRTRDVLGSLGVNAPQLASQLGAFAIITDAGAVPSGTHPLAEDPSTGLACLPVDGAPSARLSGSGRVTWRQWEPGHLRLETNSDTAAQLDVAEGFSPGWRAKVDGAEVAISPEARLGLGMGIMVPAGRHAVELTFHTPRLGAGAILSVLGFLLLLCAAVWSRRGRTGQWVSLRIKPHHEHGGLGRPAPDKSQQPSGARTPQTTHAPDERKDSN